MHDMAKTAGSKSKAKTTSTSPAKGKAKAKAAAPVAPKKPAKAAPGNGEKKNSGTPQIVITLTHDQIAARAYEVWLRKGRPEGLDRQNWVDAERELLSERRR
jgi:hypothetical protein